jgi:cardiolipin synthase
MTVLTPANQLTLVRVLLIPAFVILVVYHHFGWALVAFATAGATDALDGLIARRTGNKSTIGAWLDPTADKLLLVTTFVVLTLPGLDLDNRVPIWLTVLVIARDVIIVASVAIVNLAIGPQTFRPSIFGKAATVIYVALCVVILYENWLERTSVWVSVWIYAALGITLLSGFHYIVHFTGLINRGGK